MRKIIIAVCTALLLAFSILGSTSPAQAEDALGFTTTELGPNQFPDVGTDPEDGTRAPDGCTYSKFSRGRAFVDDTGQLEGKIWSSVKYDHCSSLDNFRNVTYYLKITKNTFWNKVYACNHVTKININVDGFNGWNPEFASFECRSAQTDTNWLEGNVFTKYRYPTGSEIGIGHDQDNRCSATSVRMFRGDQSTSATTGVGCLD